MGYQGNPRGATGRSLCSSLRARAKATGRLLRVLREPGGRGSAPRTSHERSASVPGKGKAGMGEEDDSP
jgi:hypothetical protein